MLAQLLRRPGLHVAVVATGLASVLAAGSVAALQLGAGRSSPAPPAAAPLEAPLDAAPERADRGRTVTPESAVQPSPLQTPPVVAPLAGLHSPDVLVRSATSLAPEVVERLRTLEGVTATTLIDAGTVSLAGADVRVAGVDASEFRGFTPQETAASDPLWQAVARGDLAVSYAVAQQRSLPLGGDVVVGDRPSRVGAVAAFGLPGTDVVVHRAAARGLGAVPDSVLVLTAPQVKTAALKKSVEAVAGTGVEIEVLRVPEVAPSKVTVTGKPSSWRELYIDSARYCPGLDWRVLASIGQIESGHGKNLGPSSAGALGPMQFMPATWAAYGLDGDGDGTADIMNPLDAVPSAASYLCRHGATRGEQGLYNAVFAYNHADWYVKKVLALAAQFE